jgi:hypothetical protein
MKRRRHTEITDLNCFWNIQMNCYFENIWIFCFCLKHWEIFFLIHFLLQLWQKTGLCKKQTVRRSSVFVVLFFETGSCYIAQASLELVVLLPQPSEYLHCRHVPPCLSSHLLLTTKPDAVRCAPLTAPTWAEGPPCSMFSFQWSLPDHLSTRICYFHHSKCDCDLPYAKEKNWVIVSRPWEHYLLFGLFMDTKAYAFKFLTTICQR